MSKDTGRRPRHLVVVLGDQLDLDSAALDDFDPTRDALWMAEVAEEATHVWSHKARIAVFLAAMRHFRDAMRRRGAAVLYRELDEPGNRGSFARRNPRRPPTHAARAARHGRAGRVSRQAGFPTDGGRM